MHFELCTIDMCLLRILDESRRICEISSLKPIFVQCSGCRKFATVRMLCRVVRYSHRNVLGCTVVVVRGFGHVDRRFTAFETSSWKIPRNRWDRLILGTSARSGSCCNARCRCDRSSVRRAIRVDEDGAAGVVDVLVLSVLVEQRVFYTEVSVSEDVFPCVFAEGAMVDAFLCRYASVTEWLVCGATSVLPVAVVPSVFVDPTFELILELVRLPTVRVEGLPFRRFCHQRREKHIAELLELPSGVYLVRVETSVTKVTEQLLLASHKVAVVRLGRQVVAVLSRIFDD